MELLGHDLVGDVHRAQCQERVETLGSSDGNTRIETLPITSFARRSSIRRAVSFSPSFPTNGDVLIPIVIEMLGSSIAIAGSGRGSSGSVSVSPMVTSGRPAIAMI